MGSAATADTTTADTYQAIPINVSFQFAPTPGTVLTADTEDLTAQTTSITATMGDALYAATNVSPNNIGLTTGTAIVLPNPTLLTRGVVFTKSFTTALGPFRETLVNTSFNFTPAFGAATAGASSLVMTPATLVITAIGTISFMGTESATTGFVTTPISYRATYTEDGVITGVFTETTSPLPAALPLFATGLGALGLLGWRRKRKARVSLLGAY